jgi:hypothetical protein
MQADARHGGTAQQLKATQGHHAAEVPGGCQASGRRSLCHEIATRSACYIIYMRRYINDDASVNPPW